MKLSGSFFIYLISRAASSGLNFALIPILTTYLSVRSFGLVSTYAVYLNLLNVLILLGCNSILPMFYYKRSAKEVKNLKASLLSICTFNLVIFTLLGTAIYMLNQNVFTTLHLTYVIFIVLVFYAYTNALMQLVLTSLQMMGRAKAYGVLLNLRFSLEFLATCIFIMLFRLSWQGRIYAYLCVSIICIVPVIYCLRRDIVARINKKDFISCYKLGSTFVTQQISTWVIFSIDVVLINHYLSVTDTGIYSAAYRVVSVLFVIATAFGQAWTPFFYKLMNSKNSNKNILAVKYIYMYIFCFFLLVVSFAFGSGFISNTFLGPHFLASAKYLPGLAFAGICDAVWGVFVYYLLHIEKTMIYVWISIVAAFSNAVINIIFLPMYGISAAVAATVISYGTGAIATIIFVNKYYDMPYAKAFFEIFKNNKHITQV